MTRTLHQNDAAAMLAAGVTHGLLGGTPVLTLDGELPVEFLDVGDRVVTRSGTRRLKEIEVTVLAHARMVRVGASTLGHDQPVEDVLVPASQPLFVRDWRAQALTGAAQALIPAMQLADGEFIRGEVLAEARLYTLKFEDACVIYAGGLELGCPAVAVVPA